MAPLAPPAEGMTMLVRVGPARTGPARTGYLPATLLWRLPLVFVAVLACYRFDWMWLRLLTSEAALRFAEWRGFSVERLGPDLIAWNAGRFQFGIACTFVDVFCGAIPLIWMRAWRIDRNLLAIGGLAAAIAVFNLLRRMGTDLAFSLGVPWAVADAVFGGLGYFVVWAGLVRWHEWHAALGTRHESAVASAKTFA
jgi:hypothetical protein